MQTYYYDKCIVNYTKVVTLGSKHAPVTKHVDECGRLHRTDGPALINMGFSKHYLHGEEMNTLEDYNNRLRELGLKKRFLDLME